MEGKIYSAIIGVMGDIGAIGKDKYNSIQKFNFRGIDDVMNVLHPLMVKHKIMLVPEVMEQSREERTSAKGGLLIYSICRVRFRFYAEDGSYIEAVTIGEGMDSGDKATNKAMSIAMKYACFQVFCIPTEEMKDPDGESPESTPKVNTVTTAMVSSLYRQLKRTGIGLNGILRNYGVTNAESLTIEQYKDAMDKLEKKPDKGMPPAAPEGSVPDEIPEGETCGLPFR